MQRTTSALTAAVLGVALAASTTIAQQAPTPGDALLTGTSSAKKTPATADEAADSQVYGMSVTRGARYLLRNGLDYLSYQQYDRALKFLRDAETRINDQKARKDPRGRKVPLELNAAELTALKQGIEAAQRGLRRASNAEAPYALSDRSRPGNGFTPATPATRLATRGYRSSPSAHDSNTRASNPSTMLGSDGDDDQGRPVRLASGEIPAFNQPTRSQPAVRRSTNNQESVSGVTDVEGPVNTPEMPPIPMVSRLPDLTAVDSAQLLVTTDAQNATKSQLAVRSGQVMPELNKTGKPEAEPLEQTSTRVLPPLASPEGIAGELEPAAKVASNLQKPTSAPAVPENPQITPDAVTPSPVQALPPSVVASATTSTSQTTMPTLVSSTTGTAPSAETSSPGPLAMDMRPLPAPATEALTKPGAQDQAPGLPMSDGTATTPIATSIVPVTSSSPTVATPPDQLTKSVTAAPITESSTTKTTVDLDTVPSSSSDQAVSQPINPGGALHQEHSDPVPASSPGSSPVAPALAPSTTVEPLVAPPSTNEDLPPLPPDLGQPAMDVPITDAPKAQTTTTTAAPVAPALSDESPPALPGNLGHSTPLTDDALPPLPANLGRSVPPTTDSAIATAPLTRVDQSPVTPPSASTVLEQVAPVNEQTAGQPTDHLVVSQPTAGVVAQPANDSLPVLPTANAQQPVSNSVEPVVPSMSSTTSELAPAANLIAPAAASDNTTPEHSQLPSSSAESSPAVPPPIVSVNPPMNTKLDALPAAVVTAPSEIQPEASSLPPALTGGTLAASADVLIPERRSGPSSLKPELQREVERIARRQEEAMQRQVQNPTRPPSSSRDTMASDLRTQTQMDISRAPSPAEARPIKAIPVPEDWVPLEPRNWSPQRKYWAAAATCHLPLYFQDPVLERYGHSVEQFVGPLGRFLTYPVDDPTQSTQRNQMLQPFFSAGLMGLQIIAWPYNLVMDPPWEAQYDLGYYRPGDNIPTDTYWLPLHGYGPPLRGSNY